MASLKSTNYAEIGRKMREIPLESPGPSYEWEELVQKLCTSNDAGLHEIGVRELETLQKVCHNSRISNK